jgi:DNA uptake protein ComE-like DNA-binding protein
MKILIKSLAVVSMVMFGSSAALAADAPIAAASSPSASKGMPSTEKKKPAAKVKQININAATAQELMTLPGISEADAQSIIAKRPYGSKGMLVSKKALPQDTALTIRELVYAGKSAKAATNK